MEQKQFKISSSLKDLIGKDLITNDFVAVFELVKNSYDAYAKKVVIQFEEDRITIADNGKGMTYNDLINKWLFLGYSAKKDGTEDSIEDKQQSYRDNIVRHYSGAKGVGRFSCDRLGKKLTLITKNNFSSTTEKLFVNWEDFERDQKKEFSEISVSHESTLVIPPFPDNKKTGTVLVIEGLHDGEWPREKILKLKQSLEKLINPFAEIDNFTIEIICKKELIKDNEVRNNASYYDKDVVNGEIKNSISKILTLKTTSIDVSLKDTEIISALKDRGRTIYKIREKNDSFPKLTNVDIHLYYLNKSAKDAFTRLMGIHLVNYGSIFLFRNGFRVLPFGMEGDDSWKLDYRAQQGYNRFIGTRDLFGRVDIQTSQVDDLKEVSSRDGGLIETEASKQLMDLFSVVHKRLERYVVGVLWGEGFLRKEYFKTAELAQKYRKDLQNEEKVSDNSDFLLSSIGSKIDFIQLIKTLINDKNIDILEFDQDLSNIFENADELQSLNTQFIDDATDLAVKTGNKELIAIFSETKARIARLEKEKKLAEDRAENAEKERDLAIDEAQKSEIRRSLAENRAYAAEAQNEELSESLEQAKTENLFLSSDVRYDVRQLIALQHHVTISTGHIHSFATNAIDAINESRFDFAKKHIEKIIYEAAKVETVSNFVSKARFNTKTKKIYNDLVLFINEYLANVYSGKTTMNIIIPSTVISCNLSFSPTELIVVIDNLLDNSNKAHAKNVLINWRETNDYVILSYSDDGDGISDSVLPKVFDYRFSTTGGGGIGLYHVKEICKKQNIKLSINNTLPKGVEFIFSFFKDKK